MDNQQRSSEQENVQRLERNLVPTSVGKWGAAFKEVGDIVCACAKVQEVHEVKL
jgi:hypothetical protein